MTLTEEQSSEVKAELLKQLDNFPEENREQIKKQIEGMNNNELEAFVEQNKLTHLDQGKCIFCSILDGSTPSTKIDENEIAIAILNINPISRGHAIIIPKDHDAEMNKELQEFAFKVGGTLLEKLKPKDITTRGGKIMEHSILNVIPIYEETNLEGQPNKATPQELQELADEIGGIERLDEVEQTISGEPQEQETIQEPTLTTNQEVPQEQLEHFPPRIP
ncbi:MAG: histidine triad (HIT) family protein [Patescibacteria group bacterium]|jgi:histidine triad (HIT) family protein